jgi:ribonuclease PH
VFSSPNRERPATRKLEPNLAIILFLAQGLRDHVAAGSCGISNGEAVLDLDYEEDSAAETDANFVMTGAGSLVEVQATAEAAVFSDAQLQTLLALAKSGIEKLVELQKSAVG